MTFPAGMDRDWRPGRPIQLMPQIGSLRVGGGDPTWYVAGDGSVWRTSLTPAGPATQWIEVDPASGMVRSRAWGLGAEWMCEQLPRLLGAEDDVTGFEPPAQLRGVWQRHADLRVPKSGRVLEALIVAILGQRITGQEAKHSWRALIRLYGQPAPFSPSRRRLLVFPAPSVWRQIPTWQWHQVGVDRARSDAIMRSLRTDVERFVGEAPALAAEGLRAIPGVGGWTAAEVGQRALGDADAVSYGDYHLASRVVYALTGERGGTDQDLELLLRPYSGHRFRIQQLVELSEHRMPRRGPRITIHDMRRI